MQKTVTVDMYTHKTVRNDGLATLYKLRDYHEAIIPRDTWEIVQELLQTIRNKEERDTWTYWLGENPDEELSGFHVIRNRKKRGGEKA